MVLQAASLLPRAKIEQVARLLPSLHVVAASQVPSPKTSANPLLPLIDTVDQYPILGGDDS